MAKPRSAPYGAWNSPVTPELIATKALQLRSAQTWIDGDDLYWTEGRPEEVGRCAFMCRTHDGTLRDLAPQPFNIRSRVHEYGGGEFAVADGVMWFSNFGDGRVYRLEPGGKPRPLTPAALGYRYADFAVDAARRRVICVREDHGPQGQSRNPTNTLVSFAADRAGRGGRILASGNAFYAAPRLSPDGKQLAYLTWNHPNMPWDGCELWVANVRTDGSLGRARQIAGGPDESIVQPEWSPAGELHFISDRTGWWNLYRWRGGKAQPLCPTDAEFASPHWRFAQSTYGFESERRILFVCTREGAWHLAHLDTEKRTLDSVETPYTYVASLRVSHGHAVFVGGSATLPTAIVRLDLKTGKTHAVRASRELAVDRGYLSTPESIEFPTANGQTAHAFYYPPHNREFTGPAGERAPLIVMSHGGPTSATTSVLDLEKQFWTSRGFAVADVNYGGSSGYGRDYRNRLRGNWGVVDVEDCVRAAEYLIARGDVDGNRLAITGGSAGGYTTLAALAFRDTFKAGSSLFGVSELESFVQDTHKYESRYLYTLIGRFPEERALYRERSPMNSAHRISVPLILFQGLEDKVVPPSQAEVIVQTLRERKVPVAYVAYEGEGHGFRRAENIRRTLEAELSFYAQVFGFTPADAVPPVELEHMAKPLAGASRA
jgi:dipeptidyl aminopeptidase/acylaminoacyl peptidase